MSRANNYDCVEVTDFERDGLSVSLLYTDGRAAEAEFAVANGETSLYVIRLVLRRCGGSQSASSTTDAPEFSSMSQSSVYPEMLPPYWPQCILTSLDASHKSNRHTAVALCISHQSVATWSHVATHLVCRVYFVRLEKSPIML